VAEAARTEAGEWRRKFAISQEVAETNAAKLTEARVELGGQKRELDAAVAQAQSTTAKLDEMKKISDSMQRQLESTKGKLNDSTSGSSKMKEEMDGKFAALGNTNQQLVEQTDTFRKKINGLEAELTKCRDRAKVAEEDAASEEQKTLAERAAKDEVLEREKQLEQDLSKMKQACKKAETEARDNKARAENAVKDLAAAHEDLGTAAADLKDRDERVAALKRGLGEKEAAVGKMTRQLDEANSQLQNTNKVRAETNLHHEKKLAEAQEKNARLLEEMRVMGQDHALELQKKATETKQAKIEYEDRLENNEKEMAGLHELLSKGNVGTQELLDGFAKERDAYEASIRGLNAALAEKDAELGEVEADKEKVLEVSATQIKGLKKEKQAMAKEFVQTVERFQASLKAVSEDHKKQKDEMSEMTSQFVTLATFVRSLEGKNAEPVDAWFKEVVKSFEMLIEQNSSVKSALEEMKDDAKKSSLGKLDEQSKTLMLEEEVSRLEFDIQTAEQERDGKEGELKRAKEGFEEAVANNKKEFLELKALLESYKGKLEKSETRCNDLQKKTAGTGERLADAHKNSSEKNKMMEDRLNELETALKKVQREQQALLEQRDTLQKDGEDKDRLIRNAKADLEQTDKRWMGSVEDMKKKLEKQQQSVSDSNKTNQQLQKQCEQTKKLLLTIQQQRANLNDENVELKKELDELYKRE
jgi:chromosome segregation ATPase